MNNIPDNVNIQGIFDKQLRRGFLGLTVLGFFALIISLMRAFTVGWQPIMALHLCFYIVLAVAAILNRYFSFYTLVAILIGVMFMLGIAGLISWGLTGMGVTPLIVCCILCTIAFGVWAGIICAITCLICFSFIGMAFHLNYFSLGFDPGIYLNSWIAWVIGIMTITMSAGLLIIALGTINKQLLSLIKTLDQRNWELLGINKKLEEEIKKEKEFPLRKRNSRPNCSGPKRWSLLRMLQTG